MKKAIGNFIDYGMDPTKENIYILKSLHKRVVNAAVTTISNGGNHLVVTRWGDPDVREYVENNCGNKEIYIDSRISNASWIIPQKHNSETERGYMSRLNAWAWKFVFEHCCDIAVEEYGDMDDDDYYMVEYFERFYPSIEILGFLNYQITRYKIVFEESEESMESIA